MGELVCKYSACLRKGLLDAAASAKRASMNARQPKPELAQNAEIAQGLADSIRPIEEGGPCTGKGYCGARVGNSRG